MQIAKKQARTTSKYAIVKYTQAFSTSNITASQRTTTIYIFLIVPLQYYWPLLHVCRFLYSLNKKVTCLTVRVVQRTIESELYLFDNVRRSVVHCIHSFISSNKSVEPIANFKPRGKCIWLIARVVVQTSVYCINYAFN